MKVGTVHWNLALAYHAKGEVEAQKRSLSWRNRWCVHTHACARTHARTCARAHTHTSAASVDATACERARVRAFVRGVGGCAAVSSLVPTLVHARLCLRGVLAWRLCLRGVRPDAEAWRLE
jgi:hypothetical protein